MRVFLATLLLASACGGPTRGRDPDIFVQPQAAVLFGRVIVGQSARVPVIVRNVGDGPLTVASVGLAGAGTPFALDAPATPFTLEPGQALPFDVVYTPAGGAADDDVLVITSDDPDESTVSLPVTAGQRGPHLRFDPPVLDWGLLEDRWGMAGALIVNDGTEPVTIEQVVREGGMEFQVFPGAAEGTMLAPGESVPITIGRDMAFEPMITDGIGRVTATPMESDVPEAHLSLRGAPMSVVGPDIDALPLEAVTLDGTPSFAPGGSISEYRWTVTQFPGGSRTATQFAAGDAQIVRDIERCPPGQNLVPQPCFFPDAPGTYTFQLDVVDVRPSCPLVSPGAACGGAAECCSFDCAGTTCAAAVEPGDVCGAAGGCAILSGNTIRNVQTVRAIPEQAVFVSLVWDGAGDLDLHLVRDAASAQRAWTAIPDDTYWNNPQPDWGVPDPTNSVVCVSSSECTSSPYTFCRRPTGDPSGVCVDASDDPRLLIDVTSSFGPEATGMKVPPADTYHVGVHYFPDENMAPRRATLRFYVLGEERFAPGTGPGAPLSLILSRNEFWYAARVIVPLAVDDTTIEGVALGAGNPQSNADPGNYPAIP